MENFVSNISDGKFSDAREELNTYVKDSIRERISGAQEEMGLRVAVDPSVNEDDDNDE